MLKTYIVIENVTKQHLIVWEIHVALLPRDRLYSVSQILFGSLNFHLMVFFQNRPHCNAVLLVFLGNVNLKEVLEPSLQCVMVNI